MKVISYSIKVRDCPKKSATGLFADFCGHPRTYADNKKSAGVSRTFEYSFVRENTFRDRNFRDRNFAIGI